MRNAAKLALATAAFALCVGAAQGRAERRAGDRTERIDPAQGGKIALSYGADRLQRVDFYPAAQAGGPLVVFVHGGGWKRGDKRMVDDSSKLTHWHALGYNAASVNYRLVPDATVEQQGADVAAAVAMLREKAPSLKFDARRIALVGHSAGAHLVALVGTDPQYLRGAGLDFGDIRGIVPLDGAAYDVAAQLADGGRLMHDTYEQAFGTDPARQAALSPTLQAGAPNAAEFLILHVQRADGTRQSRALATALNQGGSHAEVQGFEGRGLPGHAEINRRLGDPDYPATSVVDGFLARIFR